MATQKATQIITAAITLGVGLGVLAVVVGVMILLVNLIGTWFWWIAGGIILATASFVIGLIAVVVSGSATIIKALK